MPDTYPLPKFHFEVDWGVARIGFTEITGLDVETEVIEYRDGANPAYHKMKMPGMQKFSDITMKRGTFRNENDFYEWWDAAVAANNNDDVERRDLTITLLDEGHNPVVSWTVERAWPKKVQSTDLKADGNEVAIESIEIAHEGLKINNPPSG